MAKVTIVKNSDYTVVTNRILRDNKLSIKDMGLLIWMLSKPESWDYTINGIVAARGGKNSKDKRDTIRTALANIEAAGYLQRRRIRQTDGTLGTTEYMIYEVPQLIEDADTEPKSDFPILVKSTLDESIQLSKDITKYRNNNNTVVVVLEKFGLTHKKAVDFAEQYDEKQITAAIAAAEAYAAKHQTKSAAALVVQAIKENWTVGTQLQTASIGYVPTSEADIDLRRWS